MPAKLSSPLTCLWQPNGESRPGVRCRRIRLIVECFKKTRLYPQEIEAEDDPFKGEDELPALQELIDKVDSSCDAHVFIFTEDSIDVCLGNIDKTNPNWRNDLLEEIT